MCGGANTIRKNVLSKGVKYHQTICTKQNKYKCGNYECSPQVWLWHIMCKQRGEGVWQKTAKDKEDIQPHSDYKHELIQEERMDHKKKPAQIIKKFQNSEVGSYGSWM